MKKEFFSYDQQLKNLEEKGLIILNKEYAETKLKQISYYSLISGYKAPFKDGPSGYYVRGVTFEEIVKFYYFDEQLRHLFLKHILHVERQLKSLLSYHFCEMYGEKQTKYLNAKNYEGDEDEIKKMVSLIKTAVSPKSQYPYIVHFNKEYNNVPLWVAMNALTFGNVSAMYQYSKPNIKTKVSKNYDGINEKDLQRFISVIANCRNVCAHGERLFQYNSDKKTIPDTKLHSIMNLAKKKEQYKQGKKDLFAVVIALRYLIEESDFKEFIKQLKELVDGVINNCSHISEEQLYKYMGFPNNWSKITSYKKSQIIK
ncbi:MAG: Abi family protein [Clostridia bacterium]|nr:Abi family protein [Clostridia bacterium]